LDDVILLSTVLDEVRHRSVHIHQRLRALLTKHGGGSVANDPSRRFYLFSNEHHRDTYIEKDADETPNDRNDRGMSLGYKSVVRCADCD
jgi:exosome complex exonuclease DIS3/RRP44